MQRIKPYVKYFLTQPEKITIDSIPDGSVIDIGGGGEGIIAQIGNERITAIDKRQSEIDEAKLNAPTANWILADATDLPYSEDYFDNATAFFSGMYMSMETFEKTCSETYRVLKNNGEFWIWDAKISNDEDLFIIRLKITLPNGKKIKTGYGTKGSIRGVKEIKEKLLETKFHIEMVENHEKWFFIKAIKKT
ncbi:MAG: class I SAM-dependent methyltransferase [Candidatus Hodarchaeota archaeon]